jgi:hypothetical protein
MNWFRRYMIAAGVVVVAGLGAVQIIGDGSTGSGVPTRPARYGPEWSPAKDSDGNWVGWTNMEESTIYVTLPPDVAARTGSAAIGWGVVWDDDGKPIGINSSMGFVEGGISADGTMITDPATEALLILIAGEPSGVEVPDSTTPG